MKESLYFQAAETIEGVLGGTRCRFLAGRFYEIDVHPKNEALLEAIADAIEAGRLRQCDAAEAQPKLDEQLAALKARSAARAAAPDPLAKNPKLAGILGRIRGSVEVKEG